MIISFLVEGGEMKPSPVIGQKLGPVGVNIGKVIQEVNKATQSFKGMKVPVELDVNTKTKNFSVSVSSPPASELIKKELSIETASGAAKKLKVGNLSIEQLIKIAQIKQQNMTASSFKAAVKSIVGSCVSLGVLIENKEAKELMKEINEGKYDSEINSQKTELSSEKKAMLDKFFSELKTKQDLEIKKEEEAKAAAQQAAQPQAAAPSAAATAAAKSSAPSEEKKPAAKPAKK